MLATTFLDPLVYQRAPVIIVTGKALDAVLLVSVLLLLSLGLVMVTSASVDFSAHRYDSPFFFARKHLVYMFLAVFVGGLALTIPIRTWEAISPWLLFAGIVLLLLVLAPGVGRKVNGSQRWLAIGGFTLQVSELVKIFTVFYLSGYFVRRERELVGSFWGLCKPLGVTAIIVALLLLEPDFGAAMVILLAVFGTLFVAGVPLMRFALLCALGMASAVALVLLEPYRIKRLSAFVDPWAVDVKYDGGYQLTQSLIAFGRGEWFGVGLGNSVQKLFYLPEAHTDFVFSIWAEEAGLAGVLTVVALFMAVCWRMIAIALKAVRNDCKFIALVTSGFALVIGGQSFINMGVASGLLPTKGLTLPFLSYGGTSLIVCCFMTGVVLRANWELDVLLDGKSRSRNRSASVRKGVKA